MAYPYPTGNHWRSWAEYFVRYLNEQVAGRHPTDPRPVQLATLNPSEDKAVQDGILMWNPTTETVQVSKGGEWVDV